jgi:hypothetical protein
MSNVQFGLFIDTSLVEDQGLYLDDDEVASDVARLLLLAALKDANDAAAEGLVIDLSTVKAMTVHPDYPEDTHGLGFYFEAYDPEEDACACGCDS